jgi:hypothetical protein
MPSLLELAMLNPDSFGGAAKAAAGTHELDEAHRLLEQEPSPACQWETALPASFAGQTGPQVFLRQRRREGVSLAKLRPAQIALSPISQAPSVPNHVASSVMRARLFVVLS